MKGKFVSNLIFFPIVSTWFQNARRRYAGKLEAYRLYSIKHPDIVYDSESLDAFLRSKQM